MISLVYLIESMVYVAEATLNVRAGIQYFFGTAGIGIQYLKTGHSVSVFRYFSKTGHSVSVFRYCIPVLKKT